MTSTRKRRRSSILAGAVLLRDARNRALRSALQLGALLALVSLADAVVAWAAGGTFDLRLVAGAATVAGLGPVASFLHRTVIDRTELPSALPPSDPGRPAEPVGITVRRSEKGQASPGAVVVGLLILLVVALTVEAAAGVASVLLVFVEVLVVGIIVAAVLGP